MFNELIFRVFVRLPVNLSVIVFNIYQHVFSTDIAKAEYKSGVISLNLASGGDFRIADPRRLYLYLRGFTRRVDKLAKEYCLDLCRDEVRPGVFLDIGCNVGELSYYAHSLGLEYIAVDPDPTMQELLRFNLSELQRTDSSFRYECCSKGFSDQAGKLMFYALPETADGSFIKPENWIEGFHEEMEIEVVTADEFIEMQLKGKSLEIVKIEAEGFEPEVVSGGRRWLKEFSWVTCDGGAERNGETTIEVLLTSFLCEKKFSLVKINMDRGTAIFKRQ